LANDAVREHALFSCLVFSYFLDENFYVALYTPIVLLFFRR
jgi:hypothetical protein